MAAVLRTGMLAACLFFIGACGGRPPVQVKDAGEGPSADGADSTICRLAFERRKACAQRVDCQASTSDPLAQFICEEAKRIYALIDYTSHLAACEAITPGQCGCVGAVRTRANALVKCKVLHDVTCACFD